MSSLKRRIGIGAVWMVLSRLCVRFIGLISTIILARLLVPEDFGLIAIATTLVAMLEIFGAFSFDLALISNQKSEAKHYHAAWSLSILKGVAIAGILLSIAEPFASYYGDQRLASVIYVLVVTQFLESAINIGTVDFRKDLQFDKEFKFQLYSKLISFIVTIAAAFVLRNFWALLIGIFTHKFSTFVLSYTMCAFKPKWDLSAAKDILNYSIWLLVNNIFIFFNSRSDIFIIGRMKGLDATGVYSVAYELANLVTTELIWPIQRAIFPGYAKIADDISKLRTGYVLVLSVISAIAMPVGAGIGLTADYLVHILLGESWLAVIPLLSVLSIFGVVSVLTANSGAIYLAMNKPFILTVVTGVLASVRIPAIIAGVYFYDVIGVAYALLATAVILVAATWCTVAYLLKISVMKIIQTVWRVPVSCLAMTLVVLSLKTHFPASTDLLATLFGAILICTVGGLTYVATLLSLWVAAGRPDGGESHMVDFIVRKLARQSNQREST